MKKYLIKFFRVTFVAALIFAMSCSEEFLDEPVPTDEVSSVVIYGSRAGAEAYMAGMLRRMRGQYTTGHDAGGLNSMFYARSVKGNDVIQANTWFTFDYANDNREPTYRRTTFSWNFSYYVIGQLNQFIKGVEESETIPDLDKSELLGQARALRAFYYHQLVLEFAPAYSANPNFAAPPLYTEPSVDGNPMSTTAEVYGQMVEDLTYAVANLPETRKDKSFVNVDVANAFLAQIYQVLGQWENAEAAARAAYGGDVAAALDASEYSEGFNSLDNTEWIWGLPQYDDQSSYYFSAPHAQADHFVLSYRGTYFNGNFVGLFSDSDVRNLFVGGAYSGSTPASWFYWISTKFKFTFDADIPIIRTPEMILIEAEAKYRNGDTPGAQDLLYALQVNRDPAAVASGNTGDALLQEILIERRKELYAETGVEWFDAKRLGLGITRTGNHRVPTANLSPNDKKFFLKIPQAEIDANDHIDESVNAER